MSPEMSPMFSSPPALEALPLLGALAWPRLPGGFMLLLHSPKQTPFSVVTAPQKPPVTPIPQGFPDLPFSRLWTCIFPLSSQLILWSPPTPVRPPYFTRAP